MKNNTEVTKISISELKPGSHYVMLVNSNLVAQNELDHLEVPNDTVVNVVMVEDVDRAVKFIKIPNKDED